MNSLPEPEWMTVRDLSRMLEQRELSSTELVRTFIQRIERFNPEVHAIVEHHFDGALRAARAADERRNRGEPLSPLDGIPFTVKDLIEVEGMVTACGYPPFARYRSREDAHVVRKLKQAGAIVLGKTNVPLLGLDYQCENPVYGRTLNPWDPERTPGGSSGGSAAAVAAGLTPFDIGSDIGGSIRIPAHYCGIYGFKPTDSRISTRGHIPEATGILPAVRHMLSLGPLTRSMGDISLIFRQMIGEDPLRTDVPPLSYESRSGGASTPLRIGWSDRFGEYGVSGEVRRVLFEFLSQCETQGHLIEEIIPERWGINFETVWWAWGVLAGAQIGCMVPWWLRQVLRVRFVTMRGGFPAGYGIFKGAGLHLKDYIKALNVRDKVHAAVDRMFQEYDLWVVPVSMTPAIPHTKPGRLIEVDGIKEPYLAVGTAFTVLFNLTGSPVVVMPVGFSTEALPIGIQLIGRRWKDERLLEQAMQLSTLAVFSRPPEFVSA